MLPTTHNRTKGGDGAAGGLRGDGDDKLKKSRRTTAADITSNPFFGIGAFVLLTVLLFLMDRVLRTPPEVEDIEHDDGGLAHHYKGQHGGHHALYETVDEVEARAPHFEEGSEAAREWARHVDPGSEFRNAGKYYKLFHEVGNLPHFSPDDALSIDLGEVWRGVRHKDFHLPGANLATVMEVLSTAAGDAEETKKLADECGNKQHDLMVDDDPTNNPTTCGDIRVTPTEFYDMIVRVFGSPSKGEDETHTTRVERVIKAAAALV